MTEPTQQQMAEALLSPQQQVAAPRAQLADESTRGRASRTPESSGNVRRFGAADERILERAFRDKRVLRPQGSSGAGSEPGELDLRSHVDSAYGKHAAGRDRVDDPQDTEHRPQQQVTVGETFSQLEPVDRRTQISWSRNLARVARRVGRTGGLAPLARMLPGGIQAQGKKRRPMQVWVSCSGGRERVGPMPVVCTSAVSSLDQTSSTVREALRKGINI